MASADPVWARFRSDFAGAGKWWALGAAVVAFLLASNLGGCGTHPLEGKEAPRLALMGLDGRAHDLGGQLGTEVILLDFWATWCPPCREGLPAVAEIGRDYVGRGLKTYAVNIGESPADVTAFLQAAKIEVPVLLDPDHHAAGLYQVSGIPQTVLIGRDGKVRMVHSGFSSGVVRSLRSEIESLL